jgi:hypothetical protein
MEMSVKPRTSYRVSFPVFRVSFYGSSAHVAQSVEHVLGKDEVTSSILVVGSSEGMVMRYGL